MVWDIIFHEKELGSQETGAMWSPIYPLHLKSGTISGQSRELGNHLERVVHMPSSQERAYWASKFTVMVKTNASVVTLKDGRVPSHYSENWQKGKTEHSPSFCKKTTAWQGKEFQPRNRKNRAKSDDFVTPNEILNLRGSVMDAHSIWGPGMGIWSGRSSWRSRAPAQP